MSDLLHGGVQRASGALHVGPAYARIKMYLRDAHGYARSGLQHTEMLERERRKSAETHAENMRRSYVAALACLLSWLNGDSSMGGAP